MTIETILKYLPLLFDLTVLIILFLINRKLEATHRMLFNASLERKAIYDQINKEAKIIENIQTQAKRIKSRID